MNTTSGGSFLYGGGNEDYLKDFISKIAEVVIEDKKINELKEELQKYMNIINEISLNLENKSIEGFFEKVKSLKLEIRLINDTDNQEKTEITMDLDGLQIKKEYKIKLHSLYLNLQLRKLYLHYVKQILNKSGKKINQRKMNKIQFLIDENDNNLKLYEDIFIKKSNTLGITRGEYISSIFSIDKKDNIPSMIEIEIFTARKSRDYLKYLRNVNSGNDGNETLAYIISSAEKFKSEQGDIEISVVM